MGLMNVVEGEAGSETRLEGMEGGWIIRPFMLRGRLGEGDVVGRPVFLLKSVTVRPDRVEGSAPKVGPGRDESGNR